MLALSFLLEWKFHERSDISVGFSAGSPAPTTVPWYIKRLCVSVTVCVCAHVNEWRQTEVEMILRFGIEGEKRKGTMIAYGFINWVGENE